jgi:hypothetical protein
MGNMRILYKVPGCESEGQRLLEKTYRCFYNAVGCMKVCSK